MTIPALDSLRLEILMHRDCHFGSNFDVMLEYYQQDGVGVMPDFDIHIIQELQNISLELDLDEALPESARLEVEKAKERYENLREVYSDEETTPAKLLSDLILTEELEPTNEIDQIVTKGSECLELLVDLIRSDTFYNPLYPGYGRTPIFAAKALAKLQDERAIRPLFEAIGHENFFTDDAIIQALCSFGEKAKPFLLNVLKQKPLSKDNEHAAIALGSFKPDETIAKESLSLLQEEGVLKKPSLAPYLIFACSALPKEDLETFSRLIESTDMPKELKLDGEAVMRTLASLS